jgi:hypothetical protein
MKATWKPMNARNQKVAGVGVWWLASFCNLMFCTGGRTKIDEPDTPYHEPMASEDSDEHGDVDMMEAGARLERLEKQRVWEQKRKMHYQVQGGTALLKHQRPDQVVMKEQDDEEN